MDFTTIQANHLHENYSLDPIFLISTQLRNRVYEYSIRRGLELFDNNFINTICPEFLPSEMFHHVSGFHHQIILRTTPVGERYSAPRNRLDRYRSSMVRERLVFLGSDLS